MLTNKGQLFSYDFLVAVSIFMLLISIGILYTQQFFSDLGFAKKSKELEKKCLDVSNILLSEGIPPNWNPSNVKLVGLATDDSLNETKVQNLMAMDVNQVKEMFGIPSYGLRIRVYTLNGTTLLLFGNNASSYNHMAVFKRFTILDEQPVVLEVWIWD